MKTIITFLALTVMAAASTWRVSWSPNIPGAGVNYRLCKVESSGSMTKVGETNGYSMEVEGVAGDAYSVVAFNDLGEATPSVPVTIPTFATVDIEESFDLKTWKKVASAYVDTADGLDFILDPPVAASDGRENVVLRQKNKQTSTEIARVTRKKNVRAFYRLKITYG